MLNLGVLHLLAFKKMLYSRKMGNPVPPALALYTKANKIKKAHKGFFFVFKIDIFRPFLQI